MATSCAACPAKRRRAIASPYPWSRWHVARTRSRRSLDPESRSGISWWSGGRPRPGNERSARDSPTTVTAAEPEFRTAPQPRTGAGTRACATTFSTSSNARGERGATTVDRRRSWQSRVSIGGSFCSRIALTPPPAINYDLPERYVDTRPEKWCRRRDSPSARWTRCWSSVTRRDPKRFGSSRPSSVGPGSPGRRLVSA